VIHNGFLYIYVWNKERCEPPIVFSIGKETVPLFFDFFSVCNFLYASAFSIIAVILYWRIKYWSFKFRFNFQTIYNPHIFTIYKSHRKCRWFNILRVTCLINKNNHFPKQKWLISPSCFFDTCSCSFSVVFNCIFIEQRQGIKVVERKTMMPSRCYSD